MGNEKVDFGFLGRVSWSFLVIVEGMRSDLRCS